METYAIFISSPGDVSGERCRADRVIRKLQTEFDRYLLLEPVFWERQPQSAQRHFQEQVKKLPSATDLVVCLLWSRLGTPLPPDKFHRADGSEYRSGTEFEFEDAVEGYRHTGKPDLWVYRKTDPFIYRDAANDAEVDDRRRQKKLLDEFLNHWLGSPDEHFKAGFNSFADADEFERLFEQHLRQTLQARCPRHKTDSGQLPAWTSGESPYRGLAYFELRHAAVFHGRATALHAVLGQLQAQAEAARPFLLVLGASGVGKSSLLRSGLLNALVHERRVAGVDHWRHAVLRPADALDGGMAAALASALLAETALPELRRTGHGEKPALAEAFSRHPESLAGPIAQALQFAAAELRRQQGWNFEPALKLVWVFDQLEEAFRLPAAAQEVLFNALQALVDTGQVWVVAGMRSEFYPQAAAQPVLGALKAGAGQYDLPPPSPAELADIIRQPARAAGLAFEQPDGLGLDAALLQAMQDYANRNALPLLEFTLDELYRRAAARRETVLSFADYQDLGGLEGALASVAEATVNQLGEAKLPAVRDIFRQLVDWDQGQALRRRAPLSLFAQEPGQHGVVQALINARLLTSDDQGEEHRATVEPAHEALLRAWRRLADWIAADAELLGLRARLEELADDWHQAGRDASYLLNPGKQELDAKLLLAQPWVKLAEVPADYVRLSLQRIWQRRWQWRMGVGGVVLAFLGGAALFSYFNYQERQKAETAAGLALKAVDRLTYELPDRLASVPGTLKILQETFEQNTELLNRINALRGETAEAEREKASNLQKQGDQRLALGDVPGAKASYQAAHVIFAKLARQEAGSSDAQRNLSVSHNKIGDVLRAQGDLAGALASYRASLAIREKLPAQDPASADWQRDLSVSHDRIGDVLSAQGELAGALASYRASLAIREKLAAQDPANAELRRDLSISHSRIGDVLSDQGDLAGALASFRADLAITERLALQDPANAQWQYDLGISHERIGLVLASQGDLKGALREFEAKREIISALTLKDPANAGWQRDLSFSHGKIGDMLSAQGELAGALASFRTSLAIIEKLAALDPANAEWQRDLSISHAKIGDMLSAQGELAGALASFQTTLAIQAKLAGQDPANTDWQRDLSTSHNRIGDVLSDQGELAGALASYRASLAIREKLAAQDPANAGWQRDLSASHQRIGDALRVQGDLAGALASYRAGLSIAEKLATQDPANAEWQGDLAANHGKLGLLLRQMRKPDEAIGELQAVLRLLGPLLAKAPDHDQWRRTQKFIKTQLAELAAAKSSARPATKR